MSSPGIVPQNVLLISETKLKNFTDIDPNVSSSVLLPFISVVQQTKLEYIIGARYYKDLLYGVSGNTLSQTDTNFLNYFAQPMLVWAAYAEALPSVFTHKYLQQHLIKVFFHIWGKHILVESKSIIKMEIHHLII